MRRSAIRSLMMLVTILLLPLLVLVAQETSSPPIDGQVGELGVIYVQAQEQSKSPSVQPFSLRTGVTIRLSGDWGPDLYDRTPTPSVLYRYAPREIGFSEFLNLQNLKEHSLLKLASSNNPFQGRDQRDLDARMHEPPSSGRGLLNYLSYFFFPPPPHCVEQAFADYGRAISKSKPDEDANASIAANCQYLPTLPDFYSVQLSHGLVVRRVSGVESVDSTWGNFYLPSVEQVETNGLTFFVYEAQGLEQLTLETVRQFNLPEDLQGAQVDFFWAIGAPSAFPLMVDPTHRNVPLIHVVYAGADLGGNQRPVFMKLLQSSKQAASAQTKHAVVDNGVDSLQQFSTSMELLSKRVSPSVVQIFSTGYNLDSEREHSNTNLFSRRSSSGSGIIIASDGWIVTNAHVVAGSRRIRVRLNQEGDVSASQNGRSRHALLEAKLVLADRDTDLAFLKVDATGLATLELSDSSELKQGQLVLAFGSPLGLDNSVSMGVVSSVARQLDPDNPTIYIQTDAAINPGNSGGPLVDTGGHVVGVNTLILTQSGGNEGIGLAIPSNVIRSVYNQVRKEGHVHHHGIGMSARNITPALASGLGLSREDGVLIEDVIPQSPAQSSGLMPGDIVLSIDKKPVQNIRQLALGFYSYAVGENAKLEIQRGQQKIFYEIPVVEKEDVQGRLADLVTNGQNKIPQLGILALTLDDRLLPMLPPLRNRFGVVVAAKESEGAYIGEGALPGDVIYSVNGTLVDSVDSLRSALDVLKTYDAIVLQVERLGSLHYVALETEK